MKQIASVRRIDADDPAILAIDYNDGSVVDANLADVRGISDDLHLWLRRGGTVAGYRRFTSLAKARGQRVKEAYLHAKGLIDAATSLYSVGEMVRWPQLEAEARGVKAGAKAGPFMAAEVSGGLRTEAELADVVVAKADALEAYRVAVINARTAVVQDIQAAGLETLETYDVTIDARWP